MCECALRDDFPSEKKRRKKISPFDLDPEGSWDLIRLPGNHLEGFLLSSWLLEKMLLFAV